MWLDPFCRNLELAAQAEHEDDLPENLSEIADLWSSPTRTHVSPGLGRGRDGVWTVGRDRVEVAYGLCHRWPRSWVAGGNRSTALHARRLPQLQLTHPLSPGNFWA